MALHHRLIGRAVGLARRLVRARTLGVRAILLDDQGRIALVRHTYTGGWYLPGGGVKRGETIEAAARRELAEELAASDIRIIALLGVYHSRREGRDDHVAILVARTSSDRLTAADGLEIAEARWFAADALPEDTSPATRRRIRDHLDGAIGIGSW